MKYIKYALIPLFVYVMTANPVCSQINRTLDTRIADILVKVPADDPQQLIGQMELLLELEEEGLQKVLDMIIPPGTGDDTNPRYAVESLSRYLSKPGLEKEKTAWETMLLKEIEDRKDPNVKGFLMSQLNYIGSRSTVENLSKYLTDDKLHDPAIRAMRDANGEAALEIFVEHLSVTSGDPQIALVNVIGESGQSRFAANVAILEGSENTMLQKSVLACLAKLGNPDSYKLLIGAAKREAFMPESTNATGSLLDFAQTLSEQGDHALSLKICKTLTKKCSDPEQIHFRIKALLTAAGNDKIENSVSLLVDALESKNEQYRMAAINYAIRYNSPVAPWIDALKKTKSSEVKSEIIYLLGPIADDQTAGVIKRYLNDDDAGIRQQAVKSLALIQKGEAVNDILNYLLKFPLLPDTKTAKEALLSTVGKDHEQLLADHVEDAPEGAKVVLLEVIAARGNSTYFGILFDQIETGGQVRTSSLENLYKVASQEHLNKLLLLFDQLVEEDEIKHVEKAIVASVEKSEDRSIATKTLLAYANEKSTIGKFIEVLGNVGGDDALKALLDICSGDNPMSEKSSAFESYLRVVSSSSEPNDQKLLLLRMIEPFAQDTKNKVLLIEALGGVKTFLSFITLKRYLEQTEFRSDAAVSLVRVVLPSGGKDNGLEGALVREVMVKAKNILGGPESEYIRIDIDNYLAKMPDEAGFVSMFNGNDLSGWQGLATDPVKKRNLSPEELKKLQAEANEKLLENWSVQDNCIVFNGHGSNLCSIKEYGSFEMIVDWRITKKGDSGIYLRGSPQVQIWDVSRVESGAQVGSGGLYNNQTHESKPLAVADNPVGDWNTFHIIMIDERVTVYLNGQLVVDNVIMENYWDRSIPIFPAGSIELQAHGSNLAFRDIYVKELISPVYELTDEEKEEGFEVLFNGKDLSGWTGENHSYDVEDGNIVIRPQKGGGNLYTEKEYADFIFRFEFKLTPGANNGLGIRAPLGGDAAYKGYELQILDNTAPVYAKLKPYQYHGSVYGIIPAKRGYLKPVGEWNYQEVKIKGDDIKITLNGTVIVDGNIHEASKDGTPDGKDHPGLKRTRGHIGFLGHGSLLWFRNIRIKEL